MNPAVVVLTETMTILVNLKDLDTVITRVAGFA